MHAYKSFFLTKEKNEMYDKKSKENVNEKTDLPKKSTKNKIKKQRIR